MLDYLVFIIVRGFCATLRVLPKSISTKFVYFLIRCVLFFLPSYREVAYKNLQVVLPHDATKHKNIYHSSLLSFARGIIDTVNLPNINSEWVNQHVEFKNSAHIIEALDNSPTKSALFATAHFGSFEILPRCITEILHKRGWFVARTIKNRYLDKWWNDLRGIEGNSVIERRGAIKKIISKLESGDSVGILFDQNVTRNHAIFVDWFGVPAATTKGLSYALLATNVPLVIIIIFSLPNEQYKISAEICNYQDIAENSSLTRDEKLFQITERATNIMTKLIAQDYTGWFWLHRRWKTRMSEDDPAFY